MIAQYDVTLCSYSGMPIPIEKGDKEDVRQATARLIRRLRGEGFPVVTLAKGEKWEVQEPAGACLVPDYCGILRMEPVPSPYGACRECGCEDDWHEDGRGNVLCGCQACPDCGMVDAYGFHNPGCPCLNEDEEEDCWEEEVA